MAPSEFAELMPPCCTEVLDSMYFTTVFDMDTSDTLLPSDQEGYDFTLHFAGDICGIFGLRVNTGAARSIAANFLGEDEANISADESSEVMGELANMLCGSIVSNVPSDHKFVLSHPERTIDSAEYGKPIVVHFDTDYGLITTWVALEQDASAG
jgi:CheY-specific phosphatase CheX